MDHTYLWTNLNYKLLVYITEIKGVFSVFRLGFGLISLMSVFAFEESGTPFSSSTFSLSQSTKLHCPADFWEKLLIRLQQNVITQNVKNWKILTSIRAEIQCRSGLCFVNRVTASVRRAIVRIRIRISFPDLRKWTWDIST